MFMDANVKHCSDNLLQNSKNFNASELHTLLFDIINLSDIAGEVLINDLGDMVQDKALTLINCCKQKAEKAMQIFESTNF